MGGERKERKGVMESERKVNPRDAIVTFIRMSAVITMPRLMFTRESRYNNLLFRGIETATVYITCSIVSFRDEPMLL